MALEQEILIKSNSTDAAAVPSTLKQKEVAANLLDRSLFGHNGTSVFRFYEHPEKYFNEFGFANNALKLGGFLPTYFQKALESGVNIKTINSQSILGAGNITIQGGGSGGSGGSTPLLTNWDDYDAETMAGYALGAGLGVEDHELIDDVDEVLATINGTMGDEPHIIPNDTIIYKHLEVREGIDTTDIKADALEVERIDIGNSSISIDTTTGKAVFDNLDLPVGATQLNELKDVNITEPLVDGQALVYDANTKKYVNKVVEGIGGGLLLKDWANYVDGEMDDYGISAKLAYDIYNDVNGLDGILDEINGSIAPALDNINGETI